MSDLLDVTIGEVRVRCNAAARRDCMRLPEMLDGDVIVTTAGPDESDAELVLVRRDDRALLAAALVPPGFDPLYQWAKSLAQLKKALAINDDVLKLNSDLVRHNRELTDLLATRAAEGP